MKNLIPLLLTFLIACNSRTEPTEAESSAAPELPAGFTEFYQQFHGDSVYQIEHIVFPLPGIPDNADPEALANEDFKWQKEEWRMMKPIDFAVSEYIREFIPKTDEMVEERIIRKDGQFGMMRRFYYMDDGWYLIYYAGMNRIKGNI